MIEVESDRFNKAMELFSACVDLTADEQENFLDNNCGGDASLRARVQSMIDHDRKDDTDKTEPSSGFRSLIDSAIYQTTVPAQIPESIGGYRVIREIGRGGMGIVYEAEQQSPRRRVAIKVVPGLASMEHRQRMKQEAQALALIEDPGVARIYESGIVEVFGSSTPLIVMEYIDGRPIDQWCNDHNLNVDERIGLLARVADAVQAAHGRGVIHRDLKPSNIYVVQERDGSGQPKVLDFGIAQLSSSEVTAMNLTGAHSSPIGTLQYMSPEQVQSNNALIDARSDIYALGTVGYELLSGQKPLDMSESTFAAAAAKLMNDSPKPLGMLDRQLRGDVEVVISKSMDKDPQRRYRTMEAFATDLRRILANEPVQAWPPSLMYSLRKFVRRNTGFSASAAIIALLLMLSFVWIGIERSRTKIEYQTSEAISLFIVDMLQSIDPNISKGNEVSVREVVDQASVRIESGELDEQPKVQARMQLVLAKVYRSLGEFDSASGQLRNAQGTILLVHGERSQETADVLQRLAQNYISAGNYEEAEALFEQASEVLSEMGQSPLILSEEGNPAHVYYWTGRFDESEQYLRRAIAELDETDPSTDPRIGHALSDLGSVLEQQGQLDEAIEYHELGIESQLAFYGESRTEIAEAYNDYGNTLLVAGRYEDAFEAHTKSMQIRGRLLDSRHPDMAVSMNNIALVHIRNGEPEKAVPLLRESIDIRLNAFGREHQSTCSSLGNLARAYMESGQLDAALIAYDQAIDAAESTVGPDHMMAIVFRANRGECLARMGQFNESEDVLLVQYQHAVQLLGEKHFRSRSIAGQLQRLYEMCQNAEQALKWEMLSEVQ